jgi:putative transposase
MSSKRPPEQFKIAVVKQITDDLHDLGERCGKNRVYRLMKAERLRSQTGYHHCPDKRYGKPSVVVPTRQVVG